MLVSPARDRAGTGVMWSAARVKDISLGPLVAARSGSLRCLKKSRWRWDSKMSELE